MLRQPRFQWKVYKGDMVGVNRGPFMGMTGEVIRTHKKDHELRVKGVNLVKRRVWDHKTDPDQPRRMWAELEEPIHYSRVQLLDPVSQELTKVDFRYLETGERVRIAKASGAVAPKPVFNKPERPAHTLLASPFDTAVEDAHEVTYTPRGIPNYIADMAAGAQPRCRSTTKAPLARSRPCGHPSLQKPTRWRGCPPRPERRESSPPGGRRGLWRRSGHGLRSAACLPKGRRFHRI